MPTPGDLPDPEIKPTSLALAGGFFTTEPPGKTLTPITHRLSGFGCSIDQCGQSASFSCSSGWDGIGVGLCLAGICLWGIIYYLYSLLSFRGQRSVFRTWTLLSSPTISPAFLFLLPIRVILQFLVKSEFEYLCYHGHLSVIHGLLLFSHQKL